MSKKAFTAWYFYVYCFQLIYPPPPNDLSKIEKIMRNEVKVLKEMLTACMEHFILAYNQLDTALQEICGRVQ